MNPLMLINDFIAGHNEHTKEGLDNIRHLWYGDHQVHEVTLGDLQAVDRERLVAWLVRRYLNGGTLSVWEVRGLKDVDLAVDCLIAAGIGRPERQSATVETLAKRMED